MKIHLGISGAPLAKADFTLLRAGLSAVQAATPTASASSRVPDVDPVEALTRLFGDRISGGEQQAALRGSFNPASAHNEDEGEAER